MDKIYKTAEVARRVGVHSNTVCLYEKLELIPKVNRLPNGYRVFTDYHIEQFNLARTAFKVEVLQNGLRKKIINVVKLSAKGELQEAINCTNDYINQIKQERKNAEEAIELSKKLLLGIDAKDNYIFFTRKQTADYLQVTMDTLRNWEMNGLLTVKRKQNGYRVYTESDINRLKIIRTFWYKVSLEQHTKVVYELFKVLSKHNLEEVFMYVRNYFYFRAGPRVRFDAYF